MSEPTKPVRSYSDVSAPTYLRVSKVIAYVMYAWVFIGIILLGIRIFLLAFSANTATPFVEFVYRTSADYLAPFREYFRRDRLVKQVTLTSPPCLRSLSTCLLPGDLAR